MSQKIIEWSDDQAGAADLNTSNQTIDKVLQNLDLGSPFFALGKYFSSKYKIANQAYNFCPKISAKIDDLFDLSESATGYGVYRAMKALQNKLLLRDCKIIIQGFGSVGSSLAYLIEKYNLGKVVGIIERDCFVYNDAGIDINNLIKAAQKKQSEESYLFLCCTNTKQKGFFVRDPDTSMQEFLVKFLSAASADCFIPCVARYQITTEVLDMLLEKTFAGKKSPCIISGTNEPFSKSATINRRKELVNTIPSWISNCGNVILFVEPIKTVTIQSDWVDSVFYKTENYINDLLHRASTPKRLNLYESCYQFANNIITSIGAKLYTSKNVS